MSKRGIDLYIADIKDSLGKIEEYTIDLTFDKFAKDSKTIDAVVRNLSVIGEAVKNLPQDFKSRYSDIPWTEIMGMRNKVVHEYFGIAAGILWETIKRDLPALREQIEGIKNQK